MTRIRANWVIWEKRKGATWTTTYHWAYGTKQARASCSLRSGRGSRLLGMRLLCSRLLSGGVLLAVRLDTGLGSLRRASVASSSSGRLRSRAARSARRTFGTTRHCLLVIKFYWVFTSEYSKICPFFLPAALNRLNASPATRRHFPTTYTLDKTCWPEVCKPNP